jgi:DNA-binding GntR family transcriptional regulator
MRVLNPIGTGRVVDAAAAALRAAILSGELAPGEALSVPALASRLGVSRSPVREAVLVMVAEGLAVERPRRGVVVAAISREDADAIHEVRAPLEALAAQLAATRIDDAALLALAALLTEQERLVAAGDELGFFRSNAAFHAAIAAGAANPELSRLMGSLEGRMSLALLQVAARPEHRSTALAEHRRVLHALLKRDAAAAEAAMSHHLDSTRARSRTRPLRGS